MEWNGYRRRTKKNQTHPHTATTPLQTDTLTVSNIACMKASIYSHYRTKTISSQNGPMTQHGARHFFFVSFPPCRCTKCALANFIQNYPYEQKSSMPFPFRTDFLCFMIFLWFDSPSCDV